MRYLRIHLSLRRSNAPRMLHQMIRKITEEIIKKFSFRPQKLRQSKQNRQKIKGNHEKLLDLKPKSESWSKRSRAKGSETRSATSPSLQSHKEKKNDKKKGIFF